MISRGEPSAREEILHNIDPLTKGGNSSALRVGQWKLITGFYATCTPQDQPDKCGYPKVRTPPRH
jgi:hypothetical protein